MLPPRRVLPPHSDAQNASRRVLTAIYYPNGAWRPSDGGRLRLYLRRRHGRRRVHHGREGEVRGGGGRPEDGHREVEGDRSAARGCRPDRRPPRRLRQVRLEHEVLPVAAARSAAAGSAAAVEAKKAGKKAGKKAKSKAKPTDAAAPRPSAFTQWFQDLAPPLLASAAPCVRNGSSLPFPARGPSTASVRPTNQPTSALQPPPKL